MLVSAEQVAAPASSSSAIIIGSSGTGKSASIATLHRVLRRKKLPTRIIYFDFDQDGAEPILRLARAGYESMPDMIANTNRVDPWFDDIVLYRYGMKRRKMSDSPDALNKVVSPHRDPSIALDFMKDFNTLDDRCHTINGQLVWNPGQEVGAIVYDPLTSVQDIYEDLVWTTRQKELGGPKGSTIEWVDWNLLGEKVRDTYKMAKQFPCYFVAMAHLDQRTEDVKGGPESQPKQQTGKWFYTAALVKGLAMTIQKDFSMSLFTTEAGYKWIVKPNEHYRGVRSRGKEFTQSEVDQDFANVLDI